LNVVVSLSSADHFAAGVIVATDVNQSTPLRTAATQTGASGTSASATVSGVQSNDLGVNVLATDSDTACTTSQTGQVEEWDLAITGKVTGAGSYRPGSRPP
jgi:hypothetical protein